MIAERWIGKAMTQSQPPVPELGMTVEVGRARDRQGAVMRAHTSTVAWAFDPEFKSLHLEKGERMEILLNPVRERPLNLGLELVRPWELPTSAENSVVALANELASWVTTHGLVGVPRLTAVRAGGNLWIAVIDGGTWEPNFNTDLRSCATGQRVLKHAYHWGWIVQPERGGRAVWALMWADGRPVRAGEGGPDRPFVSARTARGN